MPIRGPYTDTLCFGYDALSGSGGTPTHFVHNRTKNLAQIEWSFLGIMFQACAATATFIEEIFSENPQQEVL
jgi:hypothetical protein